MKLFNSFLLFFMLNSFFAGSQSLAETPIMPTELIDTARLRLCNQIEDFYKVHLGDVNPPFLYAVSANGISQAFLCEKKKEGGKVYILVVDMERVKGQTPTCQNEIALRNIPGGLTLFPPEGLPELGNHKWKLEDFVYFGNPSKTGPDSPLEHDAIMESYDGGGTIFYCHNGNWLFHGIH